MDSGRRRYNGIQNLFSLVPLVVLTMVNLLIVTGDHVVFIPGDGVLELNAAAAYLSFL